MSEPSLDLRWYQVATKQEDGDWRVRTMNRFEFPAHWASSVAFYLFDLAERINPEWDETRGGYASSISRFVSALAGVFYRSACWLWGLSFRLGRDR